MRDGTPANVGVRAERPSDADAVRAVHEAAFPTPAEARLVDLLRERGQAALSLVADTDGRVVGNVLFSPARIGDSPAAGGLGLAPLAVLPDWQRSGIGGALVRAGLEACRRLGAAWVVVLGEPAYYGRFGFRRASDFGLANEYGAGEEFMVQELTPGGLPTGGGLVRYREEFNEVGF